MKFKKTAVILAAVAAMAISSVCSASIGSQLDKCDKVSTNFVNTIFQKNPDLKYENISGNLDEGFKTKFTSAEYTKLQQQLAGDLGKLKDIQFSTFIKGVNQDKKTVYVVNYLASFEKIQNTVAVELLYDENGKIMDIGIRVIQPAAPQNAQNQAAQPAAAQPAEE